MKINEVIKTGIIKHNGKTYDVYQVVKVDAETGELFAQSSIVERGQKEKKYPKRFIESLESIAVKAENDVNLFNKLIETNPSQELINLLTVNLNNSLHSMLLDYIGEIDSYNRKQDKLAKPYPYNVTDEELEVFKEI